MASGYSARVAAVVDPYTIVLNKGEVDGIKVGDRFVIFNIGGTVRDPETGRSLGELEIVRGTGEVIHLQEQMCTIETRRSRMLTRKTPAGLMSLLASGPIVESSTTPLPWDDAEVGDYARNI